MGSGKYTEIRGFPNGATRHAGGMPPCGGPTRGTETSKYPEEEKTTVIPQVAASERGGAQTAGVKAPAGLQDHETAETFVRRTLLESWAEEHESCVSDNECPPSGILSRAGPEKSCLNQAAPSAKAKYY